MKFCFVVRSIQAQIPTYTTTHLAFEAHKAGHDVYYTTVNSFSYFNQNVYATVVSIGKKNFLNRVSFLQHLQTTHEKFETNLSEFEAVWLRYNPNIEKHSEEANPFAVFDFAKKLSAQGVFVVNNPLGILKASSKMYLSNLPSSILPKTITTRSPIKIKNFIRSIRKPVVIKPISGFGGQDVFFVNNTKEININQIITSVSRHGYVQVQEYLPSVKSGDKRLLLLNGEPIYDKGKVAIYKRLSPKGEIRSNIHIGGRRKRSAFTDADQHIVDEIREQLIAEGLREDAPAG